MSNLDNENNKEQEETGKICDHNFRWNYDCFEDAVIKDSNNNISIPVKCSKCRIEGLEEFIFLGYFTFEGEKL